jgi:hypothetical protein
LSSLILSNSIEALQEMPRQEEMFVFGDVRILPFLDKVFTPETRMAVYLQAYGLHFDQSTLSPSIRITYRVRKGSEQVEEWVDDQGASMQHFSEYRVVLIANLPIQDLAVGKYGLEIEIHDNLSEQTAVAKDRFEIVAPPQIAQTR